MEIPQMPEISENRFSTAIAESQQVTQAPQVLQQVPENKSIQIPPKTEESEQILIGIYLKKENKTIDYYYNKEQVELILYNKNIIVGMLENIKLDILIGEKPQNA